MKKVIPLAILALILIPAYVVGAKSDTVSAPKPSIVLVHGAWADGTSWQHVIPRLEKDGYNVIAVQNPLTSLADDLATTRRVLEPQKGEVIVVGHSLGSVVVYDVLNRMILDRDLAGPSAPVVVPRTRLLLTFGSPLDKTAFLFGIQGPGTEEGAARRALAASVQPLITQPVRPPWVNVYSPWDIISGSLDYYDTPRTPNAPPDPRAIKNQRDDKARTFLAAHVEYWTNTVVFDTILKHLP